MSNRILEHEAVTHHFGLCADVCRVGDHDSCKLRFLYDLIRHKLRSIDH